MKAELKRKVVDAHGIIGRLVVLEDLPQGSENQTKTLYQCWTLELPWKDNQRNKSCIPPGEYQLRKHLSPKFKLCFALIGVPERDNILIHSGNSWIDTEGCILVGRRWAYFDRVPYLYHSRLALSDLLDLLPKEALLVISNDF